MKKIVSAMALGALVIGAASADTKLNINYRNGMNIYQGTFQHGLLKDGKLTSTVSKTFLDQDAYQNGKDSITLSASGDIFNFDAIIQPTAASDTIVFNKLEIGAKYGVGPGTLHAMGGWWRDGSSNGNIRITKDASNFEGPNWEGIKPGSAFKNRPNTFITDMTNMSISDTLVTGIVDYTLPTDAATIKVLASIMSDRAAQNTGDVPNTTQVCDGAYTWGVNVNVKLPSIVELEAIAKGNPKWNGALNEDGDDYAGATAFGFYAMPLMVNGLNLAVGGSMGMIDSGLSDLAFDLRARYAVNENLSFTTYNNISIAKKAWKANKATTDEYFNCDLGRNYGPTKQTGTTVMWNMLGVAYKLNGTVTFRGSVEEQTMLARNESAKDKDDDYSHGTEVRVTPAVELTATKGASILAGVSFAISGIGADEKFTNDSLDWAWNIPVLFRVKM